jgi:hypothetical protein
MATGNEDLFAFGYDAENYGKPAGHQQGHWGGDSGELFFNPETGYQEVRPTGVQQDVNRYRQMGADAAGRTAYQGDYGDFGKATGGFRYGQSRANDALNLHANAAEGRAPSAAEIAGKAAIGQSLTAQNSAAASSRGGPLAQMSAARDARNGAAAFRQTAIQGIQAGRANEMANARNSFSGAANAYGQNQLGLGQLELGKTQQQLQSELSQRQLNQNQQQFAENKAFDTKSQGLASDFARQGQQFQSLQADRQQNMAERQQDFNETVGAINAGSNASTGAAAWKPNSTTSDARAKLPVTRNPYGENDTIDLDDDVEFSGDDEDRRMSADRDIYRGDPYDDKSNEMLADRQRQNGQEAPADWLSAYVEKDQAPPPPAQPQAKPQMSYANGWDDTSRDDEERGVAPGTTDIQKYAYSDAVTKIVGKVNEFFSEKKGLETSSPSKKADPTKADFDQAPAREASDDRVRSFDRSFRRDTTQDQKKVRRTFEDKASKDADDMMAGMKESLAQGASTGGKAASERADRVAMDIDEKDDGQMVYSDKDAKKAAFEAGKKAGATGAKTMAPVTIEGVAPPPSWRGRVAPRKGPSAVDDEQFEHYKAHPEHRQAIESDTEWEQNRIANAARAEVPPNLYGDSPAPEGYAPSRDRDEGFAYSDKRTKTEAAHALEGQDYAYKDEFTPPEQKRGEVNHGPMAQNMEKNPLTRTAVKKDPRGMRMVDMNKLVKVHSSLIDHLQDEIEDLKGARHG